MPTICSELVSTSLCVYDHLLAEEHMNMEKSDVSFNNDSTAHSRSWWLVAERQMNGALFYVLNASYYLLVQLLKPLSGKKMEPNEEELIAPEPLEVGDQGLGDDDLGGGVRGGVWALWEQGPQAWYRGQPVL